ncbi:MAG: hypothetical protein ACYDHT_12850 [Solirubrobacteraceae bacterium]
MRSSTDELSYVDEVEIRGRVGTLAVWTIWPPDVPGGDRKMPGG